MVAGGTGGHVFPALALAVELMKDNVEVIWVGRPDSLESRVAREHGFRFEPVPAAGFSGKRVMARLRWPAVLLRGLVRSSRVMRRLSPDAVVAAGGYVSAAPLLWARLAGTPFFLLEQNCIPGRVTRLFAARARECFLTFPVKGGFDARCSVTGSPLRAAIAAGGRKDDGRTVLVLGGSGGARALTLAALDAAKTLVNLRFVILTGTRDYEMVRSRAVSSNCELVKFTDRPEELYRRATIAVTRAGGMVLSELVAFGIPAILVPFPYATDGHQDANAQHLVSVGAATLLDQGRLSGLTSLVHELMGNRERLEKMARAAHAAARPDAAKVIAERIQRCLAA